jgi:alanine racemase
MSAINSLELSKSALKHNLALIKELNPTKILNACVKANAYGHGLEQICPLISDLVDFFAVNSIDEAVQIRKLGIKNPILIMGFIDWNDLQEAIDLNCSIVLYSAKTLDFIGELQGEAKIHLKIETGLNRQGIKLEELDFFLQKIAEKPNIKLEGIYTHLANIEDTIEHNYALQQIEKFRIAQQKAKEFGYQNLISHVSNSAAALLFPEFEFEMIRFGIALYGMWPSRETFIACRQKGLSLDFAPVATWKSRLAQVKKVKRGEYISYGCTYQTARNSMIGVLPIGYFDGYPRCSSGAYVLVNGQRAPICGRICMNMMMVDLTDIVGEIQEGDEVIIMGKYKNSAEISAETLAKFTGTINYEVTTRINPILARIITD